MVSKKKKKKGRRSVVKDRVEDPVDAVEVWFDEEASEFTIVSSSRVKGAKYPWIHAVVIVDAIQMFETSYLKQTKANGSSGAFRKRASPPRASARARRKTDVRPSSPSTIIRARSSAPLNRDRSLDSNYDDDSMPDRRDTSLSSRSTQSCPPGSGGSFRSSKRPNLLTMPISRRSSRSASRSSLLSLKRGSRSASRSSSRSLLSLKQPTGSTSDGSAGKKKRSNFFLRKPRNLRNRLRKLVEESE